MTTVQDGAHLEQTLDFLCLGRHRQPMNMHKGHTSSLFHWLVLGQICVSFENFTSAMKATVQEKLSRGGAFQFREEKRNMQLHTKEIFQRSLCLGLSYH